MANVEISMITILTASKKDFQVMALRIFEENLKMKIQAVSLAKEKESEYFELQRKKENEIHEL
jgi:hypothetical protein